MPIDNLNPVERRLREVEDAVKTIASFVKNETEKNKRKIEDIQDSMKSPKMEIDTYEEKFDSIEDEIKDMKKSIKEPPAMDTSKLQLSINNLNIKLAELGNKMSKIEDSITDFATKDDLSNVNKIIPRNLDKKIEMEINGKLENQGKRVLNDFEKRISEIKADFENSLERRVEKSLGDEGTLLRNEFERKISEMKTGRVTGNYNQIQNSISTLNSKIADIENKINNAQPPERFATKDDLDKLRIPMKDNMNDKIIREIENLKDAGKRDAMNEASLQKKIQETEGRINQIVNKMMDLPNKNDLSAIRDSIKRDILNDRAFKEFEAVKSTSEEGMAIHKSIEKRIQDIEREIMALRVAENAEEKSDIKSVENEIISTRNMVLEEQAKRASILKNMQEMENEIDTLRKEKTKAVMTKDIEDAINKITVKHLGEFAKVMDKRLPSLVTREEYMSFIRDADKRLRSAETPDFTHVLRRIEMLEKEINGINAMTKDIYNRIPVVVE